MNHYQASTQISQNTNFKLKFKNKIHENFQIIVKKLEIIFKHLSFKFEK